MSVLCLRILQAAGWPTYVNTLMIQDLLADPEWDDMFTAEVSADPLFWSHVLPYGE